MQISSVVILGTEYRVTFKSDEEVSKYMGAAVGVYGGYCNGYTKEIVIANLDKCAEESQFAKDELQRVNLRHEIVHAFLNESGLSYNAKGADCWAKNEEMVDWIAIQSPKIFKVFSSLGLL